MNKEATGVLTGKWFHSVKTDRETIDWQGQFLGLASPGLYRVQLYDWLVGLPSEQRLVPATDMRYWLIYDSAEDMNRYYENYARGRVLFEKPRTLVKDAPSTVGGGK